MFKKFKKLAALILTVVMVFGVMSISAYASATDPEVTVYVTTNMFETGEYDDVNHCPVIQTFKKTESPSNHLMTGYTPITVKVSDLTTYGLSSIRSYYNSSFTGNANVLDAIIYALIGKGQTVYCGWDSFTSPNGGYINSFYNDGIPAYNDPAYNVPKVEGGTTVYYTIYSGTGLKVACTQEFEDEDEETYYALDEISEYATRYELTDGMDIVIDLSPYVIYYR